MDPQGATHTATGASGATRTRSPLSTIIPYVTGIVVVFIAAIVLSVVLHLGIYYWLITLLGAVVITTLLSSTAVPDIQEKRHRQMR